jgi:chromosome segregation ATPase
MESETCFKCRQIYQLTTWHVPLAKTPISLTTSRPINHPPTHPPLQQPITIMYNGGGGSAQDELERVKEQSRVALEQTWTRMEELQEEETRMGKLLQEKEQQLERLKMMKSMSASKRIGLNDQDGHSDEGSSDDSISKGSATGGQSSSVSSLDQDVRIQLMHQEREEKILEIKEILHDKEILLQSFQDDTAEQQETIHEQQQILEQLQAQNGCNLEAKARDKEQTILDLMDEFELLQESLTEAQQDHLELKEEWHEREDLMADLETEAVEKMGELQKKLEFYKEDTITKEQEQTEMLQRSVEVLEAMRQDFMEYMGPETSHNLVSDLRKRMKNLREKEDALARLLVGRLENKNELTPAAEKMEKLSRKLFDQLRKLGDLSEQVNDKMRYASDVEDEQDVVNKINAIQEHIAKAFDESVEELTVRLENMENTIEDDGDENIGNIKRDITKLNYTIQARFRQFLRALPEARVRISSTNIDIEGGRQRALRIDQLHSSVEDKEGELKKVEDELHKVENESDDRVDEVKKKAELLDDEVKFIEDGMMEKNRIIAAVVDIEKERRDAEAFLMEELEHVYDKGIVKDDDFGESEKYLLEKLQSRKGDTS